MARGCKRIKIETSSWKVGDAEDFCGVESEDNEIEPMAAEAAKYPPRKKPTGPGLYWLAEAGEEPHLVEVCVESDSHSMFFVILPDDDYKYPLDMWPGALWFGPLDKNDMGKISM